MATNIFLNQNSSKSTTNCKTSLVAHHTWDRKPLYKRCGKGYSHATSSRCKSVQTTQSSLFNNQPNRRCRIIQGCTKRCLEAFSLTLGSHRSLMHFRWTAYVRRGTIFALRRGRYRQLRFSDSPSALITISQVIGRFDRFAASEAILLGLHRHVLAFKQ